MEKFEIVYYRHNISEPALKIYRNRIFYYDLTFLFSGRLNYYANDDEIIMRPSDYILIPPNYYRERVFGGTPSNYISINFISDKDYGLPVYNKNGLTPEIRLILGACDEIQKNNLTGANESIGLLVKAVLSQLTHNHNTLSQNPAIIKIKKYINDNLHRKISLREIAAITFYNPAYCDIFFKKHTGETLINYILNQKINEAKRLLREGTLKVKDIALAVGYEDNNYFSRLFKEKTDYTPLEYKKLFSVTDKVI